jgi:hypothetical protein
MYIKFIYHQIYGYSFVAVLKQQKQILMNEIERPMKISNVFFIITNKAGSIKEISSNCE